MEIRIGDKVRVVMLDGSVRYGSFDGFVPSIFRDGSRLVAVRTSDGTIAVAASSVEKRV